MMRMINGHRVLGLVGMKEKSRIPECYALHGVYQSGGADIPSQSQYGTRKSSILRDPPNRGFEHSSPLVIEQGGVTVYRPLLKFRKSRLIATCQYMDMEWFEDHTNKDPSLTMRNAVRHIFSSAAMPIALKPESIIQLSERCKMKGRALNDAAQKLLQESFPSNFNTRTGTLTIRFANIKHGFSLSPQSSADSSLVAALLLRQIVTFVTPTEHVHLFSLHGAVEKIFPKIFGQTSPENNLPVAFTVSGVRFQPQYSQENKNSHLYQSFEWLVSRQPHSSIASARPVLTVPQSETGNWSQWELYDGRFWLRVRNCSSSPIVIRPFHKDDMQNFKLTRDGRDHLKNYAPGLVRWTLPAIATKGQGGQEIVVALPTLDIAVPGIEKDLSWEVRYKSVDIDSLYKSRSCVVL